MQLLARRPKILAQAPKVLPRIALFQPITKIPQVET
jgi:hypothetical protein